jgi:hypothetical protein
MHHESESLVPSRTGGSLVFHDYALAIMADGGLRFEPPERAKMSPVTPAQRWYQHTCDDP